MRAFKKITAVLITLTLIASMFTINAFAAVTFNDVDENTAFYDAIIELSGLGIINGYDNGDGTSSFKPEATITRSEFTKMLVEASMPTGTILDATTTKFTDIQEGYWAIPHIAYATGTSVINGYEDGTFRPENQVTFAEAVKMIVCTLRYNSAVTVTDPWYTGYINVANSIGVTKGAASNPDTPATRGLIAKLISNMLDTTPLEFSGYDANGKPVYSKGSGKFQDSVNNTESDDGIFMGYYENTITGSDEGLTKSQVLIDGKKYTLSSSLSKTDFADYLGRSVKYVYDNKNQITSLRLNSSDNQTVTYDCDDLYTISGLTLTFLDKDDKEIDVRLSGSVYAIYNGESVPQSDINEAWIKKYVDSDCATVTFLSNDGDSTYDVMFIEAYETYYVNAPTTSNGVTTIYDKFDAKKSAALDEDDCTVTKVSTPGGTASSSALTAATAKSVTSVAKPLTKSEGTKVVISTATVKGNVTSKDEYNTIGVASKEYEISDYFKKLLESDPDTYGYSTGNSVTLYLDFRGKVVYADVTTTSEPYGYLIDAKSGSGIDAEVQIRILTATGTKVRYPLKSTVKIDGESKSASTALDMLEANAAVINASKPAELQTSADCSQIIKYKTGTSDGKTVVTEIYTVNGDVKPLTFKAKSDGDSALYTDCNTRKLKYSSSGYTFSTNDDAKQAQFNMDKNTVVFVIPKDRSDIDNYRKTTYGYFSNSGVYSVEPYNVDGITADAVVVYSTSTSTSSNVTVSTNAVIVESINDVIASDGEEVKEITFMALGKDATETAVTEKKETLDGVKAGDVIKFVKDNGKISKYQLVYSDGVLYDYKDTYTPVECKSNYFSKDSSSGGKDVYRVIYGTVYATKIEDGNGTITVSPAFAVKDEETGEYTLNDADKKTFTLKEGTTKYYEFGSSSKKTEILTTSYGNIAGSNDTVTPDLATKVIVIEYSNVVKGVIYIK